MSVTPTSMLVPGGIEVRPSSGGVSTNGCGAFGYFRSTRNRSDSTGVSNTKEYGQVLRCGQPVHTGARVTQTISRKYSPNPPRKSAPLYSGTRNRPVVSSRKCRELTRSGSKLIWSHTQNSIQ